jgi:hypothetical protein
MKVAEEAMQRKVLTKPRTFWTDLGVDPTMLQPSPILNARSSSATSRCRCDHGPVPADKAANPDVAAAQRSALHPVDTSLLDQLQSQAATPMTLQSARSWPFA